MKERGRCVDAGEGGVYDLRRGDPWSVLCDGLAGIDV